MATFTEASEIPYCYDAFDIKEIWFTNMLLLGFDPVQEEKKHKICFNKVMFNLPLQKQGMEVILHHLFSQLNSHLSYEEFRDCWPVYDKKQDQLFRKKSANWITTIAKDEPTSGLPRIIAPLLLSPGGDKFDTFLYIFSLYCLKKVVLREAKEFDKDIFLPSSITISQGKPLFDEEATQLHIISHCNQFLAVLDELSHLHQKWREFVKAFEVDYRRLSKEKRELENRSQELGKSDDTCHLPSSKLSPISESLREKNKKKVRSLWKRVEQYSQSTSCEREIMNIIITSSNSNKYCIDGKEFSVHVPDEILRHMTSSNQVLDVNKEPINLSELLNVCSFGLKYFKSHILKGPPLPDLSDEIEYSINELRAHSDHVASSQYLRGVLTKHKEILRDRIQTLEQELKESRESSKNDVLQNISSLLPFMSTPSFTVHPPVTNNWSLLPPSPEVLVELTPPPTGSLTPYRPIINETVLSTPSAIEGIARSVQRRARKQVTTPTDFGTESVPVTSSTVTSTNISCDTNTPVTTTKNKKTKHVSRTSKTRTARAQLGLGEASKPIRTMSSLTHESPPSPRDLLAEQIASAVIDPGTPMKADVTLAFLSRDCISRTPIGSGRPPLDTPMKDFNWLSKETPPTPFHEVHNMDSPEDLLPTQLVPVVPTDNLLDL